MKKNVSRRIFLMSAGAAMAGCATGRVPKLKSMGYASPNEKLNMAAIGSGGKGSSDIRSCAKAGENVIALCDVDWNRASKTFNDFPDAKKYKDFRVMLEKEPSIDACTVSTPDHTHAVAAAMAMRMGKHVYVQKPLTHTMYEARKLTEIARETGVATQMGNQGHSGEGVRQLCEMIWTGAIGQIREAHIWTNRPVWPQGIPEPLPEEPIPDTLDWDLWIGTAPMRPYNHRYMPHDWRGWWDFGCCALGDMGCHIMDPANWALRLTAPTAIECVSQDGANKQTGPFKSTIRYEFPERFGMIPVTIYWHDGGNQPPRPEGIGPDVKMGDGNNGSYFIGEKGILTTGEYGDNSRFLSEEMNKDYRMPDPMIPRSLGHTEDWLQACKGGLPACSNFNYAGPFTEFVVVGNVALRCEGRLEWDSAAMKFTNNSEANKYVHVEYRKGWTL
ncbi:MAG TPA: Gfo/Idh/MocA family oxidoreductase [bacterium]|nr:Gfo/Idh/MocA family oxidoreductase [bacterium]HQO35773.1 Gfo/Idh/MocA family oxidoreductase [bacterium]HQP98187.1 Gfo/Idh/MocA family oxidoreductase [bacterium]